MGQQTDFTLLVDAFKQKYTTNVDILKARLKIARQQPNQDVAMCAHLPCLSTSCQTDCPHQFHCGLSDSSLRWELRKSKPATADDAPTMAMELNSFLESEKSASPHLQTSESAVNRIQRNPSDKNSNNLMDQFVQTLTEKLNQTMPPTKKSRDSRSSSVDSSANKSVRFRTNNSGNKKNQNSQQNRGRSPEPKKTNKSNNKIEPCKQCKRNNHESRDYKACSKCGRVGHFKNESRSTQNNNIN